MPKNLPQTDSSPPDFKTGFVSIIGAPNAGKSSLMNRYIGEKLAIVTAKPQTTRYKLLGVLTEPKAQIIFRDTPGIHESNKTLNKEMVAMARRAINEDEICMWLVDGTRRGPEHEKALELIRAKPEKPLIVAINKVDLIDPEELPKVIDEIKIASGAAHVFAVSAKTGQGLKQLKKAIIDLLPIMPPFFDEDDLTDQSIRSISAEYIREAIFELTSQEIPYSSAVSIDVFEEPDLKDKRPLYRLTATIHVERDSQKKVMIGEGGRMIKNIGTRARKRLEKFLEGRVFLSLFVRVTDDWSEKRETLAEFGYLDLPDKNSPFSK